MLNELTKNLPDGVREAVGAGLAAGLGAATGGAAGAGTAFNADSNNRQLHQVEAKALDRLKEGKSEEEQYRLTAAACAYVQCADGVPTDDPQYAALKQLQLDGAGYTAERSAIEKTGAFEQYGPVAYATDLRTSHEEAVTRTKGAFGAIGGALGVVGGYQMAAGAAVLCPETGISCLGIPAGIGLATLSYGQGQDGVAQLTGPYTSTQGLQVLASFNPKRPDGWNPLAQDAVDLGLLGLQTLISKGGEKFIAGKVEGGSKTDAKRSLSPVVKINLSDAVDGSFEYDLLNSPSARTANTKYELDNGNSFLTNSAGYVEELTFTPTDVKVPRDSRQTEAGKLGRSSDVGGHAQACSQGGTCDDYNLFPQDSNFNNSAYKVFYENEVKRALSDPSPSVGPTTIKFGRSDPSSPRPDTLSVTYTIDGKTRTRIFENEAKKIPRNN
ncbi:DNA/RNA non-specific endonuclease [Xanthomonas vasicola]